MKKILLSMVVLGSILNATLPDIISLPRGHKLLGACEIGKKRLMDRILYEAPAGGPEASYLMKQLDDLKHNCSVAPKLEYEYDPFKGVARDNEKVKFFLSPDGIFDKPLFVVEGYDAENEYDNNGIYQMLPQRIRDLQKNGVDIVTVNLPYNDYFLNGKIEGHYSEQLRDILVGLNELKEKDSSEHGRGVGSPAVLVGASMGGLVSRLALLKAERNFEDHGIGLFISYDTPNQGAYIPSDILHMLQKLKSKLGDAKKEEAAVSIQTGGLYHIFGGNALRQKIKHGLREVNKYLKRLDNPTVHEMVNYNDPDSLTLFLRSIQSQYPEKCRNIAFSNGKGGFSGKGVPFSGVGNASIKHIDKDTKLFDVTEASLTIHDFNIKNRFKENNAPGSPAYIPNQPMNLNAYKQFIEVAQSNGMDLDKESIIKDDNRVLNYTFVKATSALDYDPASESSPFDEIYYVPRGNPDEYHTQINGSANIQHLLDEISRIFRTRGLPKRLHLPPGYSQSSKHVNLDVVDNGLNTNGEYIDAFETTAEKVNILGVGSINYKWDVDMYKFKSPVARTYHIHLNTYDSHTINIKAGKSSNSQHYFRSTSGERYRDFTVKAEANQMVYITIWDQESNNGMYELGISSGKSSSGELTPVSYNDRPKDPIEIRLVNMINLPDNDGTNSQNDANGFNEYGVEITELGNMDNGGFARGKAKISRVWDVDRYYFTSPVTGKITVTLSNNKSNTLSMKAGTSSNSQNFFRSENSMFHKRSFNVVAGQTVHFTIWDASNSGYQYTLNMDFQEK